MAVQSRHTSAAAAAVVPLGVGALVHSAHTLAVLPDAAEDGAERNRHTAALQGVAVHSHRHTSAAEAVLQGVGAAAAAHSHRHTSAAEAVLVAAVVHIRRHTSAAVDAILDVGGMAAPPYAAVVRSRQVDAAAAAVAAVVVAAA